MICGSIEIGCLREWWSEIRGWVAVLKRGWRSRRRGLQEYRSQSNGGKQQC